MNSETDLIPLAQYAIAAAIAIAISLVFHYLAKSSARPGSLTAKYGLWGLIIGQDGRTSTSKLNATLWTVAIVFVLLVLLIDGRFDEFKNSLQEEYLLLLGGPYAAAIGAKAITVSKDKDGTAPKDSLSTEQADKEKATKRVAEVVADDDGQIDYVDFQYFAFTVVALAYFFANFISQPENGLPEMPPTLVGLTSASALAYLTKKGVYKNEPVITALSPKKAGPGEKVKIFGTNLVRAAEHRDGRDRPSDYAGEVLFAGATSDEVKKLKSPPGRDQLEAVVPPAKAGDADVTVIPEGSGSPTAPESFEITAGVEVGSASPTRIVLGETTEITITGSGFVTKGGKPTAANAVQLDGVELSTSDWTPTSVTAQLLGSVVDLELQGLGENQQADLVVLNWLGQRSAPIKVRVDVSEPIEANP